MLRITISVLLAAVSFCSCLIFPASAHAQQFKLPPELIGSTKKQFDEVVNAIVIFTSGNAVSSGAFKFDPSDDSDVDLNVFSLPLNHIGGEKGDTVRPVIEFVLGNAKTTRSVPVPEIPGFEFAGTADFSRTDTWSGSLGGGAEIDLGGGFSLRPVMHFTYSHLRREFDYNNEFSELVQELFDVDRDVLNTSVEVMTYAPSVRLGYEVPLGESRLSTSARYNYLWNNQVWGKSSILDVEGDSSFLQTKIEAEVPLGCSLYELPLGLHPFVNRTDIYGAAKNGFGFAEFHEVGLDLTFDTTKESGYLTQATLGSSYTFADDFSGWRVGVGLAF